MTTSRSSVAFEWQLGYEPLEELVVDADDVLRVECTWDRTLDFMPEPRYITWNEGTEDEMCWTSFVTVPELPAGVGGLSRDR